MVEISVVKKREGGRGGLWGDGSALGQLYCLRKVQRLLIFTCLLQRHDPEEDSQDEGENHHIKYRATISTTADAPINKYENIVFYVAHMGVWLLLN